VLWLREAAIQADVRVLPAIAQVVGSLLESHVLEHFTWADTRGGAEQVPEVAGAQTYDERLGHCKAPGVRSADELFGIGAGPPLNRLLKP
jgi:hypothetical protein